MTTLRVEPAGLRRFYIVSNNGTGSALKLDRALAQLKRRVGITIERTRHNGVRYVTFPALSKATGTSCDAITAADLERFVQNS